MNSLKLNLLTRLTDSRASVHDPQLPVTQTGERVRDVTVRYSRATNPF